MTREEFFKYWGPIVQKINAGTGLFPSVTLAQMLIESANKKGEPGKGITAVKANNYFGIKADKSWKGPVMEFSTPGDAVKISKFRVYSNPIDSIKDRVNFLTKMPRYTKAGVFKVDNPKDQALALAKAGYSEKPETYGQTIAKIIDAYKLEQYDTPPKKKTLKTIGVIFAGLLIAKIIEK